MGGKLLIARIGDVVTLGPVADGQEIDVDEGRGKVPTVAERHGLLDVRIELELVLDIFGRKQRPSFSRPTSLARSMIFSVPSGSTMPASPVLTHPSAVLAFAVACSFLKYRMKTPGPRYSTSPEGATRTSTPGAGFPTVSASISPSACNVT